MANGVLPEWVQALLNDSRRRKMFRPETSEVPEAPDLASLLGGQQATPPADPLAQLGILDPEQQAIPGAALPIGPRRQSAATGLMPSIGEPPSPRRPDAGMDDTRFMGPQGEQAPAMDFGAATLPAGPAESQPLGRAGMSPDDRMRLLGAARNIARAGEYATSFTGPGGIELEAQGRPRREFKIDTSGVDDEEERVRRGDFESPASPASRMARQMLSEVTGQDVPEGMSAAAVMGISPVFDQMIRQRFQGENRNFQQALALERERRAGRGEARAEEEHTLKVGTGEGGIKGLSQKRQDDLADLRQQFLTRNRKLVESVDAARKGIKAVDLGGMAYYAAAVMAARASGEVGNLSQTEQQLYREQPGLLGKAEAVIDWLKSDISGERKQAVKDILNLHLKDSGARLSELATGEARAQKDRFGGLAPEDIEGYISSGFESEMAPEPATEGVEGAESAGASTSGQVHVKRGGEVRGPISRERAEAMLAAKTIDEIIE